MDWARGKERDALADKSRCQSLSLQSSSSSVAVADVQFHLFSCTCNSINSSWGEETTPKRHWAKKRFHWPVRCELSMKRLLTSILQLTESHRVYPILRHGDIFECQSKRNLHLSIPIQGNIFSWASINFTDSPLTVQVHWDVINHTASRLLINRTGSNGPLRVNQWHWL